MIYPADTSLPRLQRQVLNAPDAFDPMLGVAERISVDHAVACEILLLGLGAFSPLTGFMGIEDYDSVLQRMRLADGAIFSLPIVFPLAAADRARVRIGQRLALEGPDGLLAWLDPWEIFARRPEEEALQVFGTSDPGHPGVRRLYAAPPWCVAGPVTIVHCPASPFWEPFDPLVVRSMIAERGWKTCVAFQTRNPIHRAHEYLHKVALETVDGLLIHPLVGPTKSDDVKAPVRMEAYRTLLHRYYPEERVILAQFPFAMRYAGPREAVFHSLVRRNYGATHMIIGRDHAGVGGFYGPEAAAQLVQDVAGELGITPLCFPPVGYCRRCQGMVSLRSCPHGQEAWIQLSGTEVRAMLSRGEMPPPEFTRPEVADVLAAAYRMEG